MSNTLYLILLSVSLSAVAQLCLKLAVSTPALKDTIKLGFFPFIASAISSPLLILGLMIYGASVALWLWILSKVELSVAYPYVSIGFILTMLFGVIILNENVGTLRIAGTLLIVLGCILIGKSSL